MIFFFSATGNSLYVAERIADELGDKLVSIVDAKKDNVEYSVKEGEKIGFVFPVYFYDVPPIVKEFITKVRFAGRPSVYSVVTYGSLTARTSDKMKELANKANLSLDYSFSVHMPENYILLPIMNVPSSDECNTILAEAEGKIDSIISSLKSDDKGDHDDGKGMFPSLVSAFSRPFFFKGTGKFYTTGICTKCGMCVDICPIGVIKMVDRIPTWTEKKCLHCLACIHRCPSRAIEYGFITKNKGRYVNPRTRPFDK